MSYRNRQLLGYAASIVGAGLVGLAFWPVYDKIRTGTATSVLLLLVLLIATQFGTGPAIFASIVSTICLNFFFVPPPFDLTFPEGWNLGALITFSIVAIVVGQLSARLQRKATQIQDRYDKLRESFQQASKLEAVKQSEQLKSALLDAVTHDLRTTLTSIKAAATALMNSENGREGLGAFEPREQKEFLHMIVDQSDRLNHFIEGILEMAKVQSGNLGDRASSDSAEEIICAALARAEKILSCHQVRYVCDEDLMMYSVNPKAIAQVIFSLLENATRYAPRGSEITIAAERFENEGVRVSIEDTGPGIQPEYRQQVFKKFFQLPVEGAVAASTGPGLGLGLTIALGITEAHGGKIWIEGRKDSQPGTSAVFTLKGREGSKNGPKSELNFGRED